jgi:hypothetical protein
MIQNNLSFKNRNNLIVMNKKEDIDKPVVDNLRKQQNNQIVNCKKNNLNKLGYANLEDWLSKPEHVYIGRDQTRFIKGAKKSKWSNPFSVNKYGRDECLVLYRKHITTTPELYDNLDELKDKTLGCWCAPESCHGDILFELLQNKDKKQNEST